MGLRLAVGDPLGSPDLVLDSGRMPLSQGVTGRFPGGSQTDKNQRPGLAVGSGVQDLAL